MASERSSGPRRVRVAVVATAALLLVGAAVGFGLWIDHWQRQGWTGIAYFGTGVEPEHAPLMPPAFRAPSGHVQSIYPGSPAARAGLVPGDRLLTVAGVPAEDGEGVARATAGLARGDRVVFEVAGDDGAAPRRVPLVLAPPLASPSLRLGLVSSLFVGLAYLLIATLVALRRPSERAARVLFLLGLVSALFFACWALADVEMRGRQGVLPFEQQIATLFLFCAGFVTLSVATGNLLLHLALVFPRPRPIVERRPALLAWVHTLSFLPAVALVTMIVSSALPDRWQWASAGAAGVAALALAALLVRKTRGRGADGLLDRPFLVQGLVLALAGTLGGVLHAIPERAAFAIVFFAFLGFFGVTFVVLPLGYGALTVVTLVRGYRASGVEEKRQLRWPLWGTSVAILGATVVVAAMAIAGQIWPKALSMGWVGDATAMTVRLFYLLIPVSFAFAIAKYRLMEIDLVLRKTAVYGALTLFVLVAYLGIAGIAGMGLVSLAGVEDQTLTVVLTLALAAALVPVRNRVQALVDRRVGRRPADRARLLSQLGREALGAGGLEGALARFAEGVQQALDSRAVVVLAAGPDGGEMTVAAKVGLPDEKVGRLRLSPAELPPDERRVVLADQASLADDTRARFRRLRLAALAVARRQGAPVGVVAAGRPLGGDPLDAADLDFLASAADQLSLVLGTLAPRREAAELSQARDIQRALLPATLPSLPGVAFAGLWQPAREVAGDYYDVLPFADGRAGLCIADVVGKGMPAALVMSSLQGAVRAVAGPDVPPDRVASEVRRVVVPNLAGGRFVTFFYAVLDPARRRLDYTNAGHLPPLLVRADGSVRRLSEGGGALVRLLAGTPLAAGTVDLLPGDRLVLFTDGVSEARPPAGEPYGEERLAALVAGDGRLGAEALAATIAAEVRAFAGGEIDDDLTLLVATVD